MPDTSSDRDVLVRLTRDEWDCLRSVVVAANIMRAAMNSEPQFSAVGATETFKGVMDAVRNAEYL